MRECGCVQRENAVVWQTLCNQDADQTPSPHCVVLNGRLPGVELEKVPTSVPLKEKHFYIGRNAKLLREGK